MRIYRRKRFTLVQMEHPSEEGRAYRVLTPSGDDIGIVATYMATMQRKHRGNRFVSARWRSLRWYAQEAGGRIHFNEYETPGRAADALVSWRDRSA